MKKRDFYILFFFLAVFLGLCLPFIANRSFSLPHEADKAAMASRVAHFSIPDLAFQILVYNPMETEYCGNVIAYYVSFWFRLFGASIFVIRLAGIAYSAVFVGCVFFVLRTLFRSRIPVLITLMLLVFDPIFIQASRLGVAREELFEVALLWLGLALLVFAVKRRRILFFYLAAFVWGVGLWAKIMFLAYVFGGLAVLPFMWKHIQNKNRGRITGFGLCFLLGMSPLIVGNLMPDNFMVTLKCLGGALFNINEFGRDNTALFINFIERIDHLVWLLCGIVSVDDLFVPFFSMPNYYALFFYFVSFVFVLLRLGVMPCVNEVGLLRKIFFSGCLFYFVCFLSTCFVPTIIGPLHILVLWPFPHICAGIFVYILFLSLKKKSLSLLLTFVLTVPLLTGQFLSMSDYFSQARNIKPAPSVQVLKKAANVLRQHKARMVFGFPYWVSDFLRFFMDAETDAVYMEAAAYDYDDVSDGFYLVNLQNRSFCKDYERNTFSELSSETELNRRFRVEPVCEIRSDISQHIFCRIYKLNKKT